MHLTAIERAGSRYVDGNHRYVDKAIGLRRDERNCNLKRSSEPMGHSYRDFSRTPAVVGRE